MGKQPDEIWKFKEKCPKCGATKPRHLIWGYLTPESLEAVKKEGHILGGCCVVEGVRNRYCRNCGFGWCTKKRDQKWHESMMELNASENKWIEKQDKEDYEWLKGYYEKKGQTMGQTDILRLFNI